MAAQMASERAFLGSSAVLFAAGTAGTILCREAMSGMGSMPMPGGWTMSMTWMRMSGQTWTEAAASFLAMWAMMMVTMMLPSLVSMLSRYRRTTGANARLGKLTVLVGLGYFLVWTAFGVAVFPLGVALTAMEMQLPALARAVPTVIGVAIVALGAFQFSAWKARYLACCRETPRCRTSSGGSAWQHGVQLGLRCVGCCANLMTIPLIIGVMDLRAMGISTVAITLERLAPERVARAIGVVVIALGLVLLARQLIASWAREVLAI